VHRPAQREPSEDFVAIVRKRLRSAFQINRGKPAMTRHATFIQQIETPMTI